MYNRYSPGLLDVIFELAGGGGGRAGRIRLWSAIVLVLMATLAAIGGYLLLMGTPTTLAAAQIESGYRPNLQRWTRRGRRVPNQYHLTAHLADGEAVVFSREAGTWRCAPLVSERGDADQRRERLLHRDRGAVSGARAPRIASWANCIRRAAISWDACGPRRPRATCRPMLSCRSTTGPCAVPGERAVAARHRRRRGRDRADWVPAVAAQAGRRTGGTAVPARLIAARDSDRQSPSF